ERLGVLGVRGHLALAVHVERERDVAGLGEAHRLVAGVLVHPPPLVDDEDAGALPLDRVVVGEDAHERRVALLVLDLLRLHRGAPRRGKPHPRDRQGQDTGFHGSLLRGLLPRGLTYGLSAHGGGSTVAFCRVRRDRSSSISVSSTAGATVVTGTK